MRFIQFAATFLSAIWLALVMAPAPAIATEFEKEVMFSGSGAGQLQIISTTDIDLFQPLIEAFQKRHPTLSILYVQASSTNVFEAITSSDYNFDLAISSAMDLQTKAANDGYASEYR
ncbi:MAG: ABC transporter substrate-binding protein, partial [Paracoccaceae bacterium]